MHIAPTDVIDIIIISIFAIPYLLGQYFLSKKLSISHSWIALVPIFNFYNLVKIAGLSNWWILGIFVPIWNIYVMIVVYRKISQKTGHFIGWWTVALFFAPCIFLPITAFHYQKGDENIPRPFIRIKKFFVILTGIIFTEITITVIFFTVTYPTYDHSQLPRGRDTSRMSALKEISMMLSLYYRDHGRYPAAPSSGCVPSIELKQYIFGKMPKDPIPGYIHPGCHAENPESSYSYRTGTGSDGRVYIILGAHLENPFGGNSIESIDTITLKSTLKKGSGNQYYIWDTPY